MTVKNENRVSFTVRLNLNNPRTREAWKRLRSGSGSYTAAIVDALTKDADSCAVYLDADGLKTVVRQAVAEALHEMPVYPVNVSADSSGKDEISDEDFDIADDFMSGLGC